MAKLDSKEVRKKLIDYSRKPLDECELTKYYHSEIQAAIEGQYEVLDTDLLLLAQLYFDRGVGSLLDDNANANEWLQSGLHLLVKGLQVLDKSDGTKQKFDCLWPLGAMALSLQDDLLMYRYGKFIADDCLPSGSQFFHFLRCLYAKLFGFEFNDSLAVLAEPYCTVFEAWEHPLALKEILAELCNYHQGPELLPEEGTFSGSAFTRTPEHHCWAIFPLAYNVTRVCRERLGLVTIPPEHLLLDPALVNLPTSKTAVGNEIRSIAVEAEDCNDLVLPELRAFDELFHCKETLTPKEVVRLARLAEVIGKRQLEGAESANGFRRALHYRYWGLRILHRERSRYAWRNKPTVDTAMVASILSLAKGLKELPIVEWIESVFPDVQCEAQLHMEGDTSPINDPRLDYLMRYGHRPFSRSFGQYDSIEPLVVLESEEDIGLATLSELCEGYQLFLQEQRNSSPHKDEVIKEVNTILAYIGQEFDCEQLTEDIVESLEDDLCFAVEAEELGACLYAAAISALEADNIKEARFYLRLGLYSSVKATSLLAKLSHFKSEDWTLPGTRRSQLHVVLDLLVAEMLQERQIVELLSSLLRSDDEMTADEKVFDQWAYEALKEYTLVLADCLLRNKEDIQGNIQAPYEQVFLYWNETEALRGAIQELNEYHISRATYLRGRDFDITEFSQYPFQYFPVEIYALRSVRQSLGLDTPLPEHPLYIVKDIGKTVETAIEIRYKDSKDKIPWLFEIGGAL